MIVVELRHLRRRRPTVSLFCNTLRQWSSSFPLCEWIVCSFDLEGPSFERGNCGYPIVLKQGEVRVLLLFSFLFYNSVIASRSGTSDCCGYWIRILSVVEKYFAVALTLV